MTDILPTESTGREPRRLAALESPRFGTWGRRCPILPLANHK